MSSSTNTPAAPASFRPAGIRRRLRRQPSSASNNPALRIAISPSSPVADLHTSPADPTIGTRKPGTDWWGHGMALCSCVFALMTPGFALGGAELQKIAGVLGFFSAALAYLLWLRDHDVRPSEVWAGVSNAGAIVNAMLGPLFHWIPFVGLKLGFALGAITMLGVEVHAELSTQPEKAKGFILYLGASLSFALWIGCEAAGELYRRLTNASQRDPLLRSWLAVRLGFVALGILVMGVGGCIELVDAARRRSLLFVTGYIAILLHTLSCAIWVGSASYLLSKTSNDETPTHLMMWPTLNLSLMWLGLVGMCVPDLVNGEQTGSRRLNKWGIVDILALWSSLMVVVDAKYDPFHKIRSSQGVRKNDVQV